MEIASLDNYADSARMNAASEVASVFETTEDLLRLPTLREQYQGKFDSTTTWLSSTVASQVQEVENGMELLTKVQSTLSGLSDKLSTIERLCEECTRLVESQDRIQLISQTNSNLGSVITDTEAIFAFPEQAKQAELLLRDELRLEEAFEYITVLDSTCNTHRTYIKNKGGRERLPEKHMRLLVEYFDRVAVVVGKFEDKLFSHFHHVLDLAEEDPGKLVLAVRLVELQERIDKANMGQLLREARDAGGRRGLEGPSTSNADSGSLGDGIIKAYGQRMVEVIAEAIENRFTPLLRTCGMDDMLPQPPSLGGGPPPPEPVPVKPVKGKKLEPAAPDPDPQGSLPPLSAKDVLEEAEALVGDLIVVYDKVVPCFPAKYAIFDVFHRAYHTQITRMVHVLGWHAGRMSNADILAVFRWLHTYREQMAALGVEDEHLALGRATLQEINPTLFKMLQALMPEGAHTAPGQGSKKVLQLGPSAADILDAQQSLIVDGPDMLINKYLERMVGTLKQWSINLVETDVSLESKQDADGKLTTAGPVDLFRIYNEQIAVVEDIDQGEILFKVARALLGAMDAFQKAERSKIESDLMPKGRIEHLCAMVNSNLQCYDLSEDFQEYVKEVVADGYKEELDIDDVCRAFLDVAKEAMSALAAIVFQDPGMQGVMTLLYTTDDWRTGRVTACLLDTFRDWFQDFETFVDKSFVPRIKESILDNCATALIMALLAKFPTINAPFVERYKQDELELAEFFSEHVSPKKVSRVMQQLQDLHQMCTGRGVDEVAVAYQSLLQSQPGVTPPIVEKLLGNRSDLPKKTLTDLMKRVQDVFKGQVLDSKIQAAQAQATEDRMVLKEIKQIANMAKTKVFQPLNATIGQINFKTSRWGK